MRGFWIIPVLGLALGITGCSSEPPTSDLTEEEEISLMEQEMAGSGEEFAEQLQKAGIRTDPGIGKAMGEMGADMESELEGAAGPN